ncbi:hypothetical protein scyTo_0006243 [Scyliorhinus torazame]|uniref:Fanconi anemia group D2 protein n=1 Tax=Scyliorhinus torazame TaxID=75743 RepID=A0A401PGR6_SCYTO|nr:hypothetical protein [Scyliorhinus torazame]
MRSDRTAGTPTHAQYLGSSGGLDESGSVTVSGGGRRPELLTMVAKRRLSKSTNEPDEITTKDVARAKKRKIGGRKQTISAQEGEVDDGTVFVQSLKSAGVTLKYGNQPNKLTLDQAVFQKKLYQALRKHPRYPNVIQEFISGLESHIEDRDKFRNCLFPCGQSQEGESSNSVSYQESLIKLLLGIEILQSPVMNTLFEKIPEFMYDGVPEDGINMPRLIINQFKWLGRIVDSKDLTSKIIQLISVAPLEVQRHIITSLPEILEDAQHSEIAKELNCLLQQNTQLTVPILDALSSLNLCTELLVEVRHSVMSTLSAVKLDDLPVVVKFILHAITAADAVEVITELRKNLELESCVLPSQMQASQDKRKQKSVMGASVNQVNSGHDCVAIMFNVIKAAVRFQKATAEAWIKAIEIADSAAEHKVIDLLVLLILHTTSTSNGKKQVEKLFRSKIRLSHVGDQLLQVAFRSHALVVREYFPSVLYLAQILLRSPDGSVVSFGSQMYKHTFMTFDSYCQQEVVGALVTHVCSGFTTEVDISLDVLMDLVSQSLSTMAVYAIFVKGILDYMDNLSPQQIRKLFFVLGTLAFSRGQDGSHIQDDMHIVIRKQLSSTLSKYKRIGIIGAVMMVGCMAYDRSKIEPISSDLPSMSKESFRQATALLELVRTCSEHSAEAAALYYDELANLVQKGNLDPQVQELIGRSVLDDFQEDFVVDLLPETDSKYLLPLKSMYNLDEEDTEGGIVINLLPLLSNSMTSAESENVAGKQGNKKCISPVSLASFFRLLRFCEEVQHSGNLEEIDALLGCPLYMTNLELVEKIASLSKQEQELLCSLLFHTLNWFREVVNAFCKQQDTEMKGKVLLRLQNITHLQVLLEKCLAATPGYVPPLANFDVEITEAPLTTAPAAPAKKGKKDQKSKKKQKSEDNKNSSTDSSQTEDPAEETQVQSENTQGKENIEEGKVLINLNNYRAYFRELDTDVFIVLRCGLVTKSVLDTELHTKATEVVQLSSPELVFLLEDLYHKLDYMLVTTATNKMLFLKVQGDRDVGFSHLRQKTPQALAQFAVELLNPLCGFAQHGNRKLLKLALGVLANRLKAGDGELELEELVRQTFRYLQNFHSSIPRCATAVTLTQLLIVIAKKSLDNQYKGKIASIARGFLCQSWVLPTGEKEKGNKYNEALETLLCFIEIILTEMELLQYFSLMCGYIFVMQHGRLFIESFLKQGMPLLDNSFKKHREDAQSLLKTLQLSTRQLHHMCGHTKLNQDTNLTNHVPPLKRLLELFVCRVKAMLTINKCQEAFWLGNLKNRDLQGGEILSQAESQQESGDDEESELPEDNAEEESEEDLDGGESDTRKATKDDEGISEDSDSD